MRALAIALLFSSSASAQPAKPRPTLAVVEVVQVFHECSGAGGEHYVLRIHDGRKPPRLAHAGGHAVYLFLSPRLAPKTPTFLVAELDVTARPAPQSSGWCLDRLPAFDASARRLVRARSRADAERIRGRFAATGLPGKPPAWGVEVIDLDRTTAE
jgi:hypothetical protein